VPRSHRLAGKDGVTAVDIAAEPLVGCTGMGPQWTTFWRLEPRPDSAPATVGPTLAETYEDKLEAIADGTAIALVPAGDRRYTLRPELVTVALDGVEPCQVVVGTRATDTNPLVAEFVRSAKDLLVGPPA
jgi:DNA-binding transcriptional LysR family regulator